MFDRLNNYYAPTNNKLKLVEMGYTVFKEVCYNGTKDDLKDSILHFIERDRDGETIDRTIVKNAVELYTRLGQALETENKEAGNQYFLYVKDLEAPLLEATRHYYAVASKRWLTQMSIPEYLAKVEEIFAAEMERVSSMLHAETSIP